MLNPLSSARRIAIVAYSILVTAAASATTTTGSASVGATVVASCSLTATTLNFGTYTGAQLDATSTITVTCTNTTSYNIGVDHGLHKSGYLSQLMGPGSVIVSYELFQDSARSHEWSVTIGNNTVTGTGNGTAQALTVYGRVFSGSNVAPGTYTDTVTATVTY